MTKTVTDLYLDIKKIFKDQNVPSPELCAREICAFVTKTRKKDIISWAYSYMSDQSIKEAMELVRRHIDGEPIAYIIGEWDFYGETFKLSNEVLIPRADTESIVEYVLSKANQIVSPKILDLCCGSGCIGIILAKEVSDAKVVAVDVSRSAIEITRENSRRIKTYSRHMVIQADVMDNNPHNTLYKLGKFHIIVSNPPYIRTNDVITLDKGVRCFEPHIALDGGIDGLEFYRAISNNWKVLLCDEGCAVFECGADQALSVAEIMDEAGFYNIEIIEDLTGIQRIVCGKYNGNGE